MLLNIMKGYIMAREHTKQAIIDWGFDYCRENAVYDGELDLENIGSMNVGEIIDSLGMLTLLMEAEYEFFDDEVIDNDVVREWTSNLNTTTVEQFFEKIWYYLENEWQK